MRCISWNVNGLRAVIRKDLFYGAFASFAADVFAIQEIKLQEGQLELELPDGYHETWSYAEKKGYAGTAVFSRERPLRVLHTLDFESTDVPDSADVSPAELDCLNREGRLCALEFERTWFVCCYTPNSQDELRRLDLRLAWGKAFRRFVAGLAADKPVIVCGDLNVAHQEIDLKHPKTNHFHAGFSDEERADFSALLAAGFTDSFRHLHPEVTDAYTWWSYRRNARASNAGWRIDYFLLSDGLLPHIAEAAIYPQVLGSDHCPVGLELEDLG